ncbi:MAG: hypothetical protein EBU70_07530, partial [Actinobacteria bacterium]|nr:hypothetical protein [Actinomycetota bacterium]
AVPTDGAGATSRVTVSRDVLIDVLSGRRPWSEAVRGGSIDVAGDAAMVDRIRAAFDVEGLRG